MIKEAYCSYEISKLLKEKGFDEECTHYFTYEDGELIEYTNGVYSRNSKDCHRCTSPTHQMATAWLREKGIECVIIPIWNTIGKQYRSYVLYDLGDKYKDNYDSYSDNISYEEAVEAALKYSLENLL
jgi:hypothetical protein